MSPDEPHTVADTVVLRYFLLADAFELLVGLIGPTIGVTSIVFDPDERGGDAILGSEMVRSVGVQQARAADPIRTEEERAQAGEFAESLDAIRSWHHRGAVATVEMADAEWEMYAAVTDPGRSSEFGLVFPLGPGEAASLAIAVNRGWTLATDDNDALKALRRIRQDHPYQRIRRLLMEAVSRSVLVAAEANALHERMHQCGFWDTKPPFPDP